MFVKLAFRPKLIGFKTGAKLTEHEVGIGRRKRENVYKMYKMYPVWILEEISSGIAKILIVSLNPNPGFFSSADTLKVNPYSWKARLKALQL